MKKLSSVLSLLQTFPKSLKPPMLSTFQEQLEELIADEEAVTDQMKEFLSALVLYWFPKTVDHLRLGAYKSIRQTQKELFVKTEDLRCSVCDEDMDGKTCVRNFE